ncbi:hypothetical protein CKA32_005582 [Geitlerinema sp. FC II]|nr:hypothetical protein CKA32_005582 [Geitlerinema sp. FC II]
MRIGETSFPFQSLEGIFGFFNMKTEPPPTNGSRVSIPRRDFWVFQRRILPVQLASR